ncbi:MAG: type II toxin-antitoxin system Phd/YefM family antitoxin [Planctomycetota bacterium]|nr:type II toxin-antitoxin system Phd/YefM family antitoxin [Planctomycetota bacterium]
MKRVALATVKDNLSKYLREAARDRIVITRHGKAVGVLIGFQTEEDWFDYRLENDPRFLKRIAQARASLKAGQGIPWAKIEAAEGRRVRTH